MAKSRRLTQAACMRLQPENEYPDVASPGLALLVRASGRRTWIFRYRRPITRAGAKLTLGTFDEVAGGDRPEPKVGGLLTLAEAHLLAAQARRQLSQGVDPGEERQAVKKQTTARRALTFEWAAREFIVRYAKPKNKSWKAGAALIGLYVDQQGQLIADKVRPGSLAERWRDKPVDTIKKRDILDVFDAAHDRGKPYAGILAHSLLRKVFNWLVERDVLAVSPCAGLKKPHTAKSRDRVLTDTELKALWSTLGQVEPAYGDMVKLLLLTAQRRDEARCLSWSELSADLSSWTIPGVRAKNGDAHKVPLSDTAQAVLRQRPRDHDLCFTFTGRGPLSGLSKLKRRLDAVMLAELRKLDPAAELVPWRLHDLRRTAATRLAGLGFPQEHVEALLNHRSGKVSGVAAVYNRHSYDAEKRRCVDAWAVELRRIVEGVDQTNVVPFKAEVS